MTTIHTGNTTTTGFSVTSDVTGNLVIKTGGAGGTTALTVGADQRVSFAKPPLTAVPAFLAYRDTSNQILTTSVWQPAEMNETAFDTEGWYDKTTNYRYTPQIPGYYSFSTSLYLRAASGATALTAAIGKNGASDLGIFGSYGIPISTGGSAVATGILYMNGTTDYVFPLAFIIGTSPYMQSGTIDLASPVIAKIYASIFSGFLVRPA